MPKMCGCGGGCDDYGPCPAFEEGNSMPPTCADCEHWESAHGIPNKRGITCSVRDCTCITKPKRFRQKPAPLKKTDKCPECGHDKRWHSAINRQACSIKPCHCAWRPEKSLTDKQSEEFTKKALEIYHKNGMLTQKDSTMTAPKYNVNKLIKRGEEIIDEQKTKRDEALKQYKELLQDMAANLDDYDEPFDEPLKVSNLAAEYRSAECKITDVSHLIDSLKLLEDEEIEMSFNIAQALNIRSLQ